MYKKKLFSKHYSHAHTYGLTFTYLLVKLSLMNFKCNN